MGIALPCCLFGFSNGLTVANSVIGGIKAAGNYAGTGSGLIGAMQMMSGSLLGIFVVWLGGDVKIILACSIVLIVALISWLAAVFLYQTRQMS